MAVSANTPISEILRSKAKIEDEPKKKSREDWRKAKELEEARKVLFLFLKCIGDFIDIGILYLYLVE